MINPYTVNVARDLFISFKVRENFVDKINRRKFQLATVQTSDRINMRRAAIIRG